MRISNTTLLSTAWISDLMALFCVFVTVARGGYREVLLVALVGSVITGACCTVVIARGGWVRWAAVILVLPVLFIVDEFIRRAPAAFR